MRLFFVEEYHIHKNRDQIFFDTLFLIFDLFHDIMFRIKSFFEQTNQRFEAREIINEFVNCLRIKVCILY